MERLILHGNSSDKAPFLCHARRREKKKRVHPFPLRNLASAEFFGLPTAPTNQSTDGVRHSLEVGRPWPGVRFTNDDGLTGRRQL